MIRILLLPLLLLLATSPARAELLLLVHGWAADAHTWLRSGVVQTLARHGWRDAGVLVAAPQGVLHYPVRTDTAAQQRLYRVHLTAQAPLPWQAGELLAALRYLKDHHPDEPVTVAGHSAGGLVARLALVHPEAPTVARLVTIAAPNLGTPRALQGLDVVESRPFFCPGPGFDVMKSFFGGDGYDYLEDSRGALAGLAPPGPGSLVDWLNRQPHPAIDYAAVVRRADELVPPASQDLNRVPTLAGRAALYPTPAGHALRPADGQLLATILDGKGLQP